MSDVRLDDDRLATVLASVGEHLVVERRRRRCQHRVPLRSPWRPLLVAAVTLAVIAGAVLAIAPARRVVSGWFRVGRIELDDRPADRSRPACRRSPMRPGRSSRRQPMISSAGRCRPSTTSPLGAPSQWWTIPEGGVLVGWPDGATSLWISDHGRR